MRTVKMNLAGVEYPLCFTLWAFEQVCEKYGDLSLCLEELDRLWADHNEMETMDSYLWLLSILMQAGYQMDRLRKEPAEEPPRPEVLKHLFAPGDFLSLQRTVMEAVTLGVAREVGSEAPKNAPGGEGQAPNG